MAKQAFPIQDLLYCVSIACDRISEAGPSLNKLHQFLAGKQPGLGDIVGFTTIAATCGLIILEQHPHLRRVVQTTLPPDTALDGFANDKEYRTWLQKCQQEQGATLEVTSVSPAKLRVFTNSAKTIAAARIRRRTGFDIS